MVFRTEYQPLKSSLTLTPASPVTLIGSCFADRIASKMREHLWDAANPAGVLYNPASISKVIRLLLLSLFPEREFEKTLFLSDEKYYSWLFGSHLSAYLAADIMTAFSKLQKNFLKSTASGQTLIVTFGTAWVYCLKERDGMVVGNCHKQPASKFDRRRLSVSEISDDWNELLSSLKKRIPGLKVIFTVSPVRYIKDGFQGNILSKSILLLAIEELCDKFDFCKYFPAYEILNDDLRDYRFYASDLIHPSDEAVEYEWDKFIDTYLDEKGKALLKRGEKIFKSLSHRSLPDCSVMIPDEVKKQWEKRKDDIMEEYRQLKAEYPLILDLG